jgi:hypothetical protein
MSSFAAVLLAAFFLKVWCVAQLAELLGVRVRDPLGRIVGAYGLIQAVLIASLLGLSSFSAIGQTSLWLLFLAAAGLLAAVHARLGSRVHAVLPFRTSYTLGECTVGLFAALLFAFLVYRSLYFFDVTADAMSYELPRIKFWELHKSVFVVVKSLATNIVVNEWNGELNALWYAVLTGSDQATSFANVEGWLFGVLAFAWIAQLAGANAINAAAIGLALACTPNVLGLATTVKGDLLAIGATTAGVGWVCQMRHEDRRAGFLCAAALLGLASGAKFVLLPAVLLLLAGVAWKYRKDYLPLDSRALTWFGVITACLMVSNARYLLNWIVFGNPVVRLPGERPAISLATLLGNLEGLLHRIIDPVFLGVTQPEEVWVLALGMGALGIVCTVGLVLFPQASLRHWKADFLWIVVALVAGVLPVLLSVPWAPWSFRYFAPWIYPPAAIILARLSNSAKGACQWRFAALLLVLVFVNVRGVFAGHSEAMPAPSVGIGFRTAINMGELERKCAFHPYILSAENGLNKTAIPKQKRLQVLVLHNIATFLQPLFGERPYHDLTMVTSVDELLRKLASCRFDVVVVTGRESPQEGWFWDQARSKGYTKVTRSEFWRIGERGGW